MRRFYAEIIPEISQAASGFVGHGSCGERSRTISRAVKPWKINPALQLAEKANSYCHSERSEEFLFAECQEKERFLVAPLLGMTRFGSFSASGLAAGTMR
jgi:hypothetical protein